MGRYIKFIAVTTASLAAGAAYYNKNHYYLNDLPAEQDINNNSVNNKTITEVVSKSTFQDAIRKSKHALNRVKEELGLPGVVIGVSVNGEVVWAEGVGMANVETQTACTSSTKMRIASISKPITVSLLANILELGLVDLDKEIQEYVPYFPLKTVNGKNVVITPRLLACHKSGVRHYKGLEKDTEGDGGVEFYLKDAFTSVEESVNLFKNDDLLFSPGEKYEYTTHGYTLLSAVIEDAAKKPFDKKLRQYLDTLGLTNTHLDEIPTLVYGRASYYIRNKSGRLENAKLTDNSYKWAGGGLVSNVDDLLKFANIMLYSYQQNELLKPGFLKKETVDMLWTPVEGTKSSWALDAGYGLGWVVVPRQQDWFSSKDRQRFHVGHSGGAVGASSVLVIFPLPSQETVPSGVCVTILTNLQNAGLYKLAKETAENFIQALPKN